MIRKIRICNFKCFDEIEIPLRNLTLLAGRNGSGKSTVIQAMLLCAQSVENGKIREFKLMGEYAKLGYSNEVLYEFNEETNPVISINFLDDDSEMLFEANYDSEKKALQLLQAVDVTNYGLFGEGFEYIAAERISPEIRFSIFNDSNRIGIHGESVVNYINEYGNRPICEKLCVREVENSLLMQIEYWMKYMFNEFVVKSEEIRKSDSISLRYQEVSEGDKSNERRPSNVGFGITYILPVIVALLKANLGDIVIIENPECHLHPSAQRKIGEMISFVAQRGIQVVVETHSDHVLNGIRLAVKKKNINKSNTQILFFDREDVGKNYHTNVFAPNILDNGDLDVWPDGFFDEWDNALIGLLG